MCNFGVFFKKAISLFLLSSLLCLYAASSPAISAESAILINADSGEVISEYNADQRRGMASTTKIMTAIIAIEFGNLDKQYKIPDEAIGVEGSSLYLKKGEVMTLGELVTGLMLQSANDAAEAIAVIVGGSVEEFANMMNKKANELGLKNTNFDNPHGLSSDNHYTTARELATLTAYALKNATFKKICSTGSASISGIDGNRHIVNHNKMLSMYDGVYGVKTGYTKATGRCLVTAAERDGVNLIAVTLGAPNDWNDHRLLLDYGFSSFESVTLANAGQQIANLPVIGGTSDSIPVYVKYDVSVCLKKNRNSIIEKIELNRPKFAPVYKGDEVGRIVFFLDGIEIASSPICASDYVGNRQNSKNLLERIFN